MVKYVDGVPWVVGFEKKPPYVAKTNPPKWDIELQADSREELHDKMVEYAKGVRRHMAGKVCGSTAPPQRASHMMLTPKPQDDDEE